MSQTLLEMVKDLVLAQIQAQRLSPEAMPCADLFSMQKVLTPTRYRW
jgi:hypothetical protein